MVIIVTYKVLFHSSFVLIMNVGGGMLINANAYKMEDELWFSCTNDTAEFISRCVYICLLVSLCVWVSDFWLNQNVNAVWADLCKMLIYRIKTVLLFTFLYFNVCHFPFLTFWRGFVSTIFFIYAKFDLYFCIVTENGWIFSHEWEIILPEMTINAWFVILAENNSNFWKIVRENSKIISQI